MNSTSADVVYLCSGGKRLPGKHISLGVALKSIRGSKSLVNLVNRFGHCISNENVRRIDIGMESSLTSSNHLVSDRITKTPELYTELAWDNFDVNLETLSGDDSVDHSTEFAIKIYYKQDKFLNKSLKPGAKIRKHRILH